MQPQTPEELRQATVQEIDLVLNTTAPVVRSYYIGAEGLRMLVAQRAYWTRASLGDVQDYFTEYQKLGTS